MQNKYPNADTSPERLARIQRRFTPEASFHVYADEAHGTIRDLLAMLQERVPLRAFDEAVQDAREWKKAFKVAEENAMEKLKSWQLECAELSQQLHDQRWRRLSDETPPEGAPVQLQHKAQDWIDRCFEFKFYEDQQDAADFWWRPIPPLPTE